MVVYEWLSNGEIIYEIKTILILNLELVLSFSVGIFGIRDLCTNYFR